MKKLAEIIRTALLANQAIADLVANRVYWELGKDGDALPLIQFSIAEVPTNNKDNRALTTTVRCYGDNMDVVGDLYEFAKETLQSAKGNFQSGVSGITDDEEKEGVAELTFEFKI